MSKQRSSDLLKLETEGNGFTESLLLKPFTVQNTPENGKRTFKVCPSSVLSSVKAFLPKIAAANCDLEQKLATDPSSSVNIENTEDCAGKIIEMNLALVEQESSDEDISSESGCELDDSDYDSTSDSDSVAQALRTGSFGQVTEGCLKMPGTSEHKKPQILVLSDNLEKSDNHEKSDRHDELDGKKCFNSSGEKPD